MDGSTRRYFQMAHRFAKEGKMEEALQYCEKTALQYGRQVVPLELLDLRAAVLIKLQKFPEAGIDGKSIISQFPTDPRGYLRLAQIYRYKARQSDATDNTQKAINILKLGLSRVGKLNREFLPQVKSMKRLCDDLQESLEPAVMPDLAFKLPLELFQQILHHSSHRDVLTWRRVSRRWKDAIHSAPMWRSLQMSRNFMPTTSQQVNFLVNLARSTSNRGLLHFQMDNTIVQSNAMVRSNLKCEDLALTVIQKCGGLQTISLDFEPSRSWQQILKNIQNQQMTKLEVLPRLSQLWNHPNLIFGSLHDTRKTSIELHTPVYDERDICKILGYLPSLVKAVFCGFTLSGLGALPWQWPLKISMLRSLVLSPRSVGNIGDDAICIENLGLSQLSHFAPNMEILELGGCTFPSSESIEPADFSTFSKLKCLRIDWHPLCRKKLFLVFPKIPSTLQELMLECPDDLPVIEPETELRNICSLQHMKRLHLSRQFALDADRLRTITGPRLEKLTFVDRGFQPDFHVAADSWINKSFQALSESSQLRHLRELRMSSPFVNTTPDTLATIIASSCDNLEKLIIFGDCGFTGVGIAKLCCKVGVKLKKLELDRCPKAKADTMRYVRSQGITFSGRLGLT